MPIHSASSRMKLLQCHPDLQRLVHAVAARVNLLVVCGHRGKVEQNEAFLAGRSKLSWPHSKHNQVPSLAVDLAPINDRGELDWKDIAAFKALGEVMKEVAEELEIEIKWGGDWVAFRDFPHYELVNPSQDQPPAA